LIDLEKIAASCLQTDAPGAEHRDVNDDFQSTIEGRTLANCEDLSTRHNGLLSAALHPNFHGFYQSISHRRCIHKQSSFPGGCPNDSSASDGNELGICLEARFAKPNGDLHGPPPLPLIPRAPQLSAPESAAVVRFRPRLAPVVEQPASDISRK
jgi:hypothetical protein